MAGEQAPASGGGMDWLGLLGGGLQGLGGYFGGKAQADAAEQAAIMSEMAKSWTQLLGMQELNAGGAEYQKGMQDFLTTMQGATESTDFLPEAAVRGTQRQLGQIAGAESGAINQVQTANQQAMGGIGQNAATRGFYGSSVQGGQTNQMQANTNQSIADIMAGAAQQKSNIIGQGTQNIMGGLAGKAAGRHGLAQGQLGVAGANYGMSQDKVNLLLQTGNSMGVDISSLLGGLANQPGWGYYINPNAYGANPSQ